LKIASSLPTAFLSEERKQSRIVISSKQRNNLKLLTFIFDNLPVYTFNHLNGVSSLGGSEPMDWLNNANIITSLVLAIFGISGYIYAITTYLKKKASPTQQNTNETPQTSTRSQQKSNIYKPFSWLEWTEFFAQGLVDTADFIFKLVMKDEYDEDEAPLNKLGYCAFTSLIIGALADLVLGGLIGLLLTGLGVSNAWGAAFVIGGILLFMTFSFAYVYHVGLIVEMKQLERHMENREHLSSYQSTRQQKNY
jgi:hypothetical protein